AAALRYTGANSPNSAWPNNRQGNTMSKNIVLCCDGTGNDFHDPQTNSNVVKLYSTLVINDSQVGYYHPGVGTMGSPMATNWLEKEWSRIKGLAFGAGLLDNVADAYRYLMNTYEDGDHLYLRLQPRRFHGARHCQRDSRFWTVLRRKRRSYPLYIADVFAADTQGKT